MNRKTFDRGVIAASLIAASAAGFAYFGKPSWGTASAAALGQLPATSQSPSPSQAVATAVPGMATATDFSGIVDRYGPAVVNISVIGKAQQTPAVATPDEGDDADDPFSQFFRRFGPQMPRMPRGGGIMRGLGSGFIVSPDGLILTNAHVVDGAQEVTVKLTDRREFKAKVLGSDKQTDVAVIRIDAKNLPTVKIGNPEVAKVGEPVRFGGLVISVHACESAAPDEGFTDYFAHLDVQAQPEGLARQPARVVYRGWMFAGSPSLHPLQHPLYDVWLIACRAAAPDAAGGKT